MQALTETWSKLSLQRKGLLVGAIIATLFVFSLLARTATQPRMALLFGGLEDKAAGEIIAALDQMGIPTEVRGSSIYVPAEDQDRLRLKLAGDGLLKDGSVGYELLDDMTGFGTTREMFRTAVQRATEGELQRTIESMPDVRAAKVKIAFGERRSFSREEIKTTASVQVRSIGGRLKQSSAAAIRYLVSLGVPGLDPEQVGVIDSRHGVILKPGDERVSEAGEERDERIAERLRQKLEKLLSANLGEDNFRVEVTVETTREMRKVSEVIVDPDSQVPTTSNTTEVTEKSTGAPASVTVASNLPEGDANGAGGSESDRSEARETISYRYSETAREQIIEPGAIKKLGVGIMVDLREEVGADGQVARTPRSREELATIEQLVKSAIAFDEERGDTVRVESLPFVDSTPAGEELEEPSAVNDFLAQNAGMLIQLLVLGIVTLLLGLLVVKPILTAKPEGEEEPRYAELPPSLAQAESAGAIGELSQDPAAAAAIAAGAEAAALAPPAEGGENALAPIEGGGDVELAQAVLGAVPGLNASQSDRLREFARDRSEDAVATLKRWLSEDVDEKSAGAA